MNIKNLNFTAGSAVAGGAVYIGATTGLDVTITGCQFTANKAVGAAGSTGGNDNSTITFNKASSYAGCLFEETSGGVGFARVAGAAIDIGAVEDQTPT